MSQTPMQGELVPAQKKEANLDELFRAAQPLMEQWVEAQKTAEIEKTKRLEMREQQDTKRLDMELAAKKQLRWFEFITALVILGGLFCAIAWAAIHGKDAIVTNGVVLLAGLLGGYGAGRAHGRRRAEETD